MMHFLKLEEQKSNKFFKRDSTKMYLKNLRGTKKYFNRIKIE